MPVLRNTRHERFAQELAKGKSASEAYALAGFKQHDGNASRLSGNEKVRARVAELQGKAAEKCGVTVERVVSELAKLAFANMGDYLRITSDGDPAVDFSDLTADQKAAIAEVTVEDFVDGRGDDARDVRRVKFKLADKRAALVDLGRHLRMFTDKVEASGPNGGPIETKDVGARERIASRIAGLAARK